MKNVTKILPLLFISLSLCYCKPKETTLTLMTYNIYHGENTYDMGKSNLEDIADLIKEVNPDFVALQEVDSMTQRTASIREGKAVDLVTELSKSTGMHGFFAKAIDFSNGGYGEGLLSKYPAKMSKINLPVPQGGEGRAMAIATVTLDNGQKLAFGATHLCHQYDSNRIAQTEAITSYMKETSFPSVVAGDLNFKPDDTPYPIMEKDYIDAAAAFGNPQPTIPFDNPRSRIDYVWLSKNAKWEILDVKVIPVGHSDHMPVIVKVKLTSN